MARAPSKILSLAEKKAAETGLKTALKTNLASVKASEAAVADANKALTSAKKQADALAATANKALAKAQKDGGKLIASGHSGKLPVDGDGRASRRDVAAEGGEDRVGVGGHWISFVAMSPNSRLSAAMARLNCAVAHTSTAAKTSSGVSASKYCSAMSM